MSRVHTRSPVSRLIAAMMPEWLMAKTMLRSMTGRPAMSSSSDKAVTLPERVSMSFHAGRPFSTRIAKSSPDE